MILILPHVANLPHQKKLGPPQNQWVAVMTCQAAYPLQGGPMTRYWKGRFLIEATIIANACVYIYI